MVCPPAWFLPLFNRLQQFQATTFFSQALSCICTHTVPDHFYFPGLSDLFLFSPLLSYGKSSHFCFANVTTLSEFEFPYRYLTIQIEVIRQACRTYVTFLPCLPRSYSHFEVDRIVVFPSSAESPSEPEVEIFSSADPRHAACSLCHPVLQPPPSSSLTTSSPSSS